MTAPALLAMLALLAAPCAAQTADELYLSNEFDAAARAYGAQVEKDPFDAYAHYNLGNAEYRAGRLGPAVSSYLRAFRLNPRDADIRYNLDFTLKRTGDALIREGVPEGLFLVFHLFSRLELRALTLLFLWLSMLTLGAHLLTGRKHARLGDAGAGLLAALVFFGGWLGARRAAGYTHAAVVVVGEAEARSGPGITFNVAFTLPEGRRVEVLQRREGWLEIGVLSEGVKGWVAASALERV